MHPSVYALWAAYLDTLGETPDSTGRQFQSWSFADNEESANMLAALAMQGYKRATTSAAWYLDAQGRRLPESGDLSVITVWTGEAVCVIGTTYVDVMPFDQVSADYAALEGIADGSLDEWRNAYWDYFARQLEPLGQSPETTMPVICEQFQVVYPVI